MIDFVFPSDADRAENDQLNRACEAVEELQAYINRMRVDFAEICKACGVDYSRRSPVSAVQDLADEVERLRGATPGLPLEHDPGSPLPRYGLRWNGPDNPATLPMDDGYWTPWHLAQAEIDRLRGAVLPTGYALVPKSMQFDLEDMQRLLAITGEAFTEDEFPECTLWIGETRDGDTGKSYYGLNAMLTELPEEGSITVIEFKEPPAPGLQPGDPVERFWPKDMADLEPETSQRLQAVRQSHAEWSRQTFGNVGPVGPAKHLSKEALEFAEAPDDPVELADCQFLLWDMQWRSGITDDQLADAMVYKLGVCKEREWPEPKDGEAREHLRTGGR